MKKLGIFTSLIGFLSTAGASLGGPVHFSPAQLNRGGNTTLTLQSGTKGTAYTVVCQINATVYKGGLIDMSLASTSNSSLSAYYFNPLEAPENDISLTHSIIKIKPTTGGTNDYLVIQHMKPGDAITFTTNSDPNNKSSDIQFRYNLCQANPDGTSLGL